MASLIPTHVCIFADALELDNVFSLYRDGHDEMRVIAEPEKRKNLVGQKTYIVIRVSHLLTHETGEMILCPSNSVYLKNKEH
jgi:hypothetical protein